MKKVFLGLVLISSLLFSSDLSPKNFDEYLKSFDLKERNDMKIKSVDMLNMIENGTAVLIDIRFREEFEAWNLPFSKNIPLNELPNRLNELPKDKLIITACPHNDRSNIARMYLNMKGYNAKYLSDGLLKVADYLRGDNAVEFIQELKKAKK
jgi:rhodanese-related sulfurtransferase